MNENFRRNQRVIIRAVETPWRDSGMVGREGRYMGRSGMGRSGSHLVQIDQTGGLLGGLIRATRIEAVDEPLAAWERELLNAAPSRPSTPVAEVLVDLKRVQAAHAAHELLPKDAELDDLIGVAEFILGEHTPIPRASFEGEKATATAGARDEAAEIEAARSLTRYSKDIGRVGVRRDTSPDEDVVNVEVDGCDTYLRAEDVEALVEYLQAALVAHRADKAI